MVADVSIVSSTKEMFQVASWSTDANKAINFEALEIDSEIIREGVAEWDRLRGDRAYPLRSDIDPLRLPVHLLPHIVLIDVIDHDLPDFRWRLVGTHTTGLMQRDSTGLEWRALYDTQDFEKVALGPMRVLQKGLPCRTLTRAPARDRRFLYIESVDLPLSSDGSRIDMIIGFVDSH